MRLSLLQKVSLSAIATHLAGSFLRMITVRIASNNEHLLCSVI